MRKSFHILPEESFLVEQTPIPEWSQNEKCDEIRDKWIGLYYYFRTKAKQLIEEAGGSDKMRIIAVGKNDPLSEMVIQFLPEQDGIHNSNEAGQDV